MSAKQPTGRDYRQGLVGVLAILLLVICGWVSWRFGSEGSAQMVAAATGRVGLFLAALWLAWPSLRRPARWLPPGFAVLGVLFLSILAARPRLIVVLLPAFGVLLALATVVRTIKRS